jgi:hypothetical protein
MPKIGDVKNIEEISLIFLKRKPDVVHLGG